MRERQAEKAKEDISKPIPDPRPKTTSSSTSEAGGAEDDPGADEDGINFDRTGGEEKESAGGGIGFVTILLILIPIMGIATFFSLRAAKSNEVEDFVPDETEDDQESQL